MTISNSKYFILISAVMYAFVPVTLAIADIGNVFLFGLINNFLMVLIGVSIFLFTGRTRLILGVLRQPANAAMGSLHAIASAGSMIFAYLALREHQIASTVILELWPIFLVVLMPIFASGRISAPDPFKVVVIGVAMIGFITLASQGHTFDITNPEISRSSVLALLSAILMAASVIFKYFLVMRLQAMNLSTLEAQGAIQYFFIVPLIFLAPLGFFQPVDLAFTVQNVLAIAAASVLFFGSAALYNEFLKQTTDSTDQIVWFFSPVIACVTFAVLGYDQITAASMIGMTMIVTCNIVLNFPPEEGIAYRYSTIFLVAAGYYCVFFEGIAYDAYYQVISVAAVFYIVLATLNLENATRRAEREREQFYAVWENLYMEISQKDVAQSRKIAEKFWETERSSHKREARRNYMALKEMIPNGELSRERFIATYENYLDSRFFTSGFAEFVALLSMALVTVVAALIFRTNDFVSDMLAVSVSFSVVYLFLANLDHLRSRRLGFFEAGEAVGPLPRPRSRHFHEISAVDSRYWSVGLIIIIMVSLLVTFAYFG